MNIPNNKHETPVSPRSLLENVPFCDVQLFWAMTRCGPKIIKSLLDRKADPNLPDNSGMTPFMVGKLSLFC